MQLTILETGIAPAGLAEDHGTYGDMFERMLAPHFPELKADKRQVFAGAALPDVSAAEAYLITGSPAGVYEDHAWIAPLEAFIHEVAAAGIPLVGICFGHQLMAQAFGGRVEKSHKGWGVGVHKYELVADAPIALEAVTCALSHQDQVVVVPEEARVLGGSAFCPNGIIEYGKGACLSFQMHPEFQHDFARALLATRSDRIPAEIATPAHTSLEGTSNRDVLAAWIAEFYKNNRGMR